MAKHKETLVDLDKAYESNVIGLRGIVYFAAGLFFSIVVTFVLMWFLLNQMEADAAKAKASENPIGLTKTEALPPEPRLQAAPGFGVDDPNKGRINLELRNPQSEYDELYKQWEKIWAEGQKDPKTGTVITLGIEDAKNKYLDQNAAKEGDLTANDVLKKSKMIVSDAAAGRNSSTTIR